MVSLLWQLELNPFKEPNKGQLGLSGFRRRSALCDFPWGLGHLKAPATTGSCKGPPKSGFLMQVLYVIQPNGSIRAEEGFGYTLVKLQLKLYGDCQGGVIISYS